MMYGTDGIKEIMTSKLTMNIKALLMLLRPQKYSKKQYVEKIWKTTLKKLWIILRKA